MRRLILFKGSDDFQIDDDCFPVREGSVVCVSPAPSRGMRNSSDEPMIYMVVQSKENSVGNYSTEDGTRTFYTELLHWIKEVLSENFDLMKSLLYNDLAEEKAKSLVGLDVINDWSQESIEILFKLVLMYANREPYY